MQLDEECNCIGEGDVVEHIMNTNVFGVVIGSLGSLMAIRVSPSLQVLWFHCYELRPLGDDSYEPEDGSKEEVPADNVVNFTKAKALRANTKTRGAA